MIEPEFNHFLRSIVGTLEQLGLTYGIGGSVASSLYGEARSTLDVDISVVLPLDRVLAFTQAFQALGKNRHRPSSLHRLARPVRFPKSDRSSIWECNLLENDLGFVYAGAICLLISNKIATNEKMTMYGTIARVKIDPAKLEEWYS